MAELGAQENTYAYFFWVSFNKNFLTIQGNAKQLLQMKPRQSGGVSGGVSGRVSFTAIETGSARAAWDEMDMAFWSQRARRESGLAARAA